MSSWKSTFPVAVHIMDPVAFLIPLLGAELFVPFAFDYRRARKRYEYPDYQVPN